MRVLVALLLVGAACGCAPHYHQTTGIGVPAIPVDAETMFSRAPTLASQPGLAHVRTLIREGQCFYVDKDRFFSWADERAVPTCGPVRDGIGLGWRDPAPCDTTWSPPVTEAEAIEIAEFRALGDPRSDWSCDPMVRIGSHCWWHLVSVRTLASGQIARCEAHVQACTGLAKLSYRPVWRILWQEERRKKGLPFMEYPVRS